MKDRKSPGSPTTDRIALSKTRFASQRQWRDMRKYDVSTWDGVRVDRDGRVMVLDLHERALKCDFPHDLCDLDALQELILHTNCLTGFLPARIGELHNLEKLDLWDNLLEGPIPTTLAKLTKLRELHLSGNFFSGPIPKNFGKLTNLAVLYLHGNKLTGGIPREICQLKKLRKLVLINNRLTGPIPVELAQLKYLIEINLANNRLSGPIPTELGELENLVKLYLWGNNLSGAIPEELGLLSRLEKLDLAQNQLLLSGGGIPNTIRKHANFRKFVFSVPEDGAPIPPWKSKRSAMPALVIGYLDLFTDIAATFSYKDDEEWWFVVGMTLVVGPALLAAVFVFGKLNWWRRAAIATQLGLIVESWISYKQESYSEVLVALRVLQPLYESLPQIMLQTYVILLSRRQLGVRLCSLVVSLLSLSYALTGVVAEHPLSQLKWARGVDYPAAKSSAASGLFFGTVPYVGSVAVRGGFRIHPQDFVWWFLFYQVLEITARMLALSVLALVWDFYIIVAVFWLMSSRWFISRASLGSGELRETLRFRVLVRSFGMPFLDSVLDRPGAYKLSCFLTCVETVFCLAAGNAVTPDQDEYIDVKNSRRIYSAIVLLFIGVKLALSIGMIIPFKKKISRSMPAVKGELREAPQGMDKVLRNAEKGSVAGVAPPTASSSRERSSATNFVGETDSGDVLSESRSDLGGLKLERKDDVGGEGGGGDGGIGPDKSGAADLSTLESNPSQANRNSKRRSYRSSLDRSSPIQEEREGQSQDEEKRRSSEREKRWSRGGGGNRLYNSDGSTSGSGGSSASLSGGDEKMEEEGWDFEESTRGAECAPVSRV